ncbi:conserved unknown protein [Ectocarpus siliculosus]|uniref:Uncharacterized protein n=1 Tax=Ectocarpus siliculosus TaxID=2880 RepID=D7FH27_ECTSI|nr:conserved unknown protein [Ectocarpus siliculosus]|eukprot:CBJ28405.1 conserved unknown protein [Ectocarpus siliculosus]
MTLVRQNRVVATIFAFLCLAVPSCDGFLLSPSLALARLRSAPNDGDCAIARQPGGAASQQVLEKPDEMPRTLAEEPRLNRRAYFEQLMYKSVATVAISGASSLVLAPTGRSYAFEEQASRWQPEGNPKEAASWFPLLAKCYQSLEDVLENWEKYTARQDGDAIRRLIGTIGVSSPLSSIRKAFTSIRDAEEASQGDIDVIEYVEAYMEVLTALGDAENDLYSANFADYSGGGGTKGSQFIAKANKSLKIAKDEFKEVNKILGI